VAISEGVIIYLIANIAQTPTWFMICKDFFSDECTRPISSAQHSFTYRDRHLAVAQLSAREREIPESDDRASAISFFRVYFNFY
jgi:hypothetical protein